MPVLLLLEHWAARSMCGSLPADIVVLSQHGELSYRENLAYLFSPMAHVCCVSRGAGVAWAAVALHQASLTERLAVLACPPPGPFMVNTRNLKAAVKLSYMFWFQTRDAEEKIASENGKMAEVILRNPRSGGLLAGSLSDEDLAVYRTALAEPGAATAMLNYYRHGCRPALCLGLQLGLASAMCCIALGWRGMGMGLMVECVGMSEVLTVVRGGMA
jgi:hypothetical protein